VPYIALQLKSLSMSWTLLAAGPNGAEPASASVFIIAALLAGFAILFGARRADLTEHNRGLMHAVAFESVVKLAALLAVALFAVFLLRDKTGGVDLRRLMGPLGEPAPVGPRFITIVVLSTAAAFCLPRQFHVGFVEMPRETGGRTARWVFPLYLTLTSLAVLPIVAAGRLLPPEYINPDLHVLDLPIVFGSRALTAFVFLGGFSAATAMVIVETVALSAMASNALLLPLLVRGQWRERQNVGRAIIVVRRAAIVGILALACLYFLQIDHTQGLASIGLTSFAAAAQLAPALLGAVLWRRGHASGAIAGLCIGFVVWIYTLAVPQVFGHFATPVWLDPHALLGLRGLDPLTHGVLWSLGLNTALYVGISMTARWRLIDRIQAQAFVEIGARDVRDQKFTALGGTAGDLKTLVSRFLGERGAARSFETFEHEQAKKVRDSDPVDPILARATERMLAGAIGASSARTVIASALSGSAHGPDDVVRLLDEAAQAVQFNRELLQATLDNLSQGVSVVDQDLRLVAWNTRYLELFDLPSGYVHVGRKVADVIRYNALRGECGPGEVDALVERRLEHLHRRRPHTYERLRPNGRVLTSAGAPMPGGGYVTSFTDITDLKRAAEALEEAKEQLEGRVEERTRELAEAKLQAENATASKTRFLAAASHDLLQPLHAARLFVGALSEELRDADPAIRKWALNADQSIASAHRLLLALLNLSKLEAGGVRPKVAPLAAGELLRELRAEFGPLAAEKGLRLRILPTGLWVSSDRDLLRSVLQNLIGNALRYTREGGVLAGCRRHGDHVRFEVWDTGLGVSQADQATIFKEFERLHGGGDADPGVGLGLAIVDRVSRLLDHPVGLRSELGSGSVFSVLAPRAEALVARAASVRAPAAPLLGLRVLCVDNESAILESLEALLGRWGVEVTTAASAEAAMTLTGTWDAALIDHHLGGENGLRLIHRLNGRVGRMALVTADTSEGLTARAGKAAATVIAKPVQPAVLKAFLVTARTVMTG
jgi:signal transduction histidine kinase